MKDSKGIKDAPVIPLFDEAAMNAALAAKDLSTLGIILSKYWWVENYRFKTRKACPIDPNDPVYQAIQKISKLVAPAQYSIEWAEFTLMLYPTRGKAMFYSTASFIMNGALAFIKFLTTGANDSPPGANVSRQQALEFCKKLKMFYSEEETRILADANGLLPKERERLFEVIFMPDDPLHRSLTDIVVDFSKGGEWVHEKDPVIGGGLAEIIKDPLKVVGVLARVVLFCNSLGLSFNQLKVVMGEWFQKIETNQTGISQEQTRQARAQQQFNQDITIVEGNQAQIQEQLRTIENKIDSLTQRPEFNPDPIVHKLDEVIQAINWTGTNQEERLGEIEQTLIQNDNNAELRATEHALDQSNQHEQQRLQTQIYGEGTLQGQREIKQKQDQTNLHLQIYCEGLLQHGREIKQSLERYHKGVIFQTEFFMRRVLELETQLKKIHTEIQGIYKIRDEMREIYAKIQAILEQIPNLTAAQLASIFKVKPNKMHYWLKRLRFMRLVDRDKAIEVPQLNLLDSHVTEGQSEKSSTKMGRIRKVFHYFLSKLQKYNNNPKSRQNNNGGEKIGSGRIRKNVG